MQTDPEVTIHKRGENVIQFTLSRSPMGMRLQVKAHPLVEEFMRTIAGPDASTVDVKTVGRHWVPIGGTALTAYALNEKLPVEKSDDFTVNSLGAPLVTQVADPSTGRAKDVVNISFLRLAGISEGIGVTFGIKGVHSEPALYAMRDQLGASCRTFYQRYLKPIDLAVVVSTQDLT